jgi:leucyl aminopeptidase
MMRVLWKDGQGKIPRRNAAFDSGPMIELPDFSPLRATATSVAPTRAALDGVDHLLVVAPRGDGAALARLPYGKQLAALFARARRNDDDLVSSRAANTRATGLTVAAFKATRGFLGHVGGQSRARELARQATLARHRARRTRRERRSHRRRACSPRRVLPRSRYQRSSRNAAHVTSVRIFGARRGIDLATARAQTLGNNVARWFTALPPNVLTMTAYRKSIEQIAKAHGIHSRFLSERELGKLKAGAFLAVASGNATRDAGILHLRYRPTRSAPASLALVGKGVDFDTGGTNLKPILGMLDMHRDMQGSAVALIRYSRSASCAFRSASTLGCNHGEPIGSRGDKRGLVTAVNA